MRLRDGVRAIAVFEAAKGALVLVAGFGLLSAIHRDVEDIGERIVEHFHLDPASRYPRIFIDAASIAGSHLRLIAAGAALYSLIRFIEAYGLWRQRHWAEWLAAGSAAVYIPVELIELGRHPGWITIGALVLNVAVLVFMVRALRRPAGDAGNP
jgi:uncharacterized membrane protein (DUF2068 family)